MLTSFARLLGSVPCQSRLIRAPWCADNPPPLFPLPLQNFKLNKKKLIYRKDRPFQTVSIKKERGSRAIAAPTAAPPHEMGDIPLHEFLPLPTGRRDLNPREVEDILSTFRCIVCMEIPEFSSMYETPCCSQVVHPQCISQSLQKGQESENRLKRHSCPHCRWGENPGEVFSTRSLVRCNLKSVLAATLLEDPSRWNVVEDANLSLATAMHEERREQLKLDAKQVRDADDAKQSEAREREERERAAALEKKRKASGSSGGGGGGGATATGAAAPVVTGRWAGHKRATPEPAAAAAAAAAAATPTAIAGGEGGPRAKRVAVGAKGSKGGGGSSAEGASSSSSSSSSSSVGGGAGGEGNPAPESARTGPLDAKDGHEWTREWTPSVDHLIKGVAVIALRPHAAPPPSCCQVTPLPPLPLDQTIVSVCPAFTDTHLRAFIEYRLREAAGTLPPDAPNYSSSSSECGRGGGGGGGSSVMESEGGGGG